ncbi:hypothetical protein F4861DRAFT_500915 [Xylaria intraflava]|nr:hypothetical protein F4861DRAFT_500915 [Xylaria intraflava]
MCWQIRTYLVPLSQPPPESRRIHRIEFWLPDYNMAYLPEVDIERGEPGEVFPPDGNNTNGSGIVFVNKTRRLLSCIKDSWNVSPQVEKHEKNLIKQIEDYPSGYPRFSALIASHDSFHICRRFSTLRVRLLLLKQDKLSQLEKRLEKIDQEHTGQLSLGSSRKDFSEERKEILSNIDEALADYDALIKRNNEVLGLETASHRDITNLENWVDGNGCIARAETAYLARTEDLLSVAHRDDNALAWLGSLVEDGRVYARERFGKNPQPSISRDPNVHIFSERSTARAARILITPFVVVLLLTPVIICNFVQSLTARLAVIILATTCFVAVLSGLTRVRTVELVVAGATYTTVLIVFITNTNGPGP